MMMPRGVSSTSIFDERIVCVHEHIHADLIARELGYKIFVEPAAKVNYLAFFPYSLADLPLFRWRWSLEAGEDSIGAFAERWRIADHAAYTHAPHFDAGPQKSVEEVARKLGSLEPAVRAYTLRGARWQQLLALSSWQDVATMSDVDTAILALANDTDMNLNGEVRATGRTDVGDSAVLTKAREICQILGVPGMAEGVGPQPDGAVRIPRKIRPKKCQGRR